MNTSVSRTAFNIDLQIEVTIGVVRIARVGRIAPIGVGAGVAAAEGVEDGTVREAPQPLGRVVAAESERASAVRVGGEVAVPQLCVLHIDSTTRC
jgi:hypothetical protein